MTKLSLNVNKFATLRNSRGGDLPCLNQVVKDLIKLGVDGITIHPRPDERHIRYSDVESISAIIKESKNHNKDVELNIEGYPSKKFLELMKKIRPNQCTLVPDPPEVLTSDKGWDVKPHFKELKEALSLLKKYQIRSSIFIHPLTFKQEEASLLKLLKTDRVEFYTGDYACLWNQKTGLNIYLDTCRKLASFLEKEKININAGHDLNQENLGLLLKTIPSIKEVSIGHAFVCDCLYDGLEKTFKNYTTLVKGVQ